MKSMKEGTTKMKSMKEGPTKMKSMKKLVTLLFSLVMLCAFAIPVMADGMYSITINGAVAGHTYTAYQVFKGVYYKEDGSAGKEYLSDVQWGDDVEGAAIVEELKAPTTLKALRDKFGSVNNDDKDAAEKVAYILQGLGDKSEELDEFARIVGNHLKSKTTGIDSVTVSEGKEAKITDLTAGYYFVKDTGTISGDEIATKFLVKVVGNANVTVKAQAPTFKKKIVKENGKPDNHTSANVGDKITFKLTANVPDMASFDEYTFTIHDTLSEGLTFNKDSVKVTANNNVPVTDDKYTLTYTEGDQDFTIAFTKAQLEGVVKHTDNTTTFGATIVVEYTATLNEKALKKDVETNKAYLEYTNDPSGNGAGTGKTPEAPVYVYDFDLTVDKFDGTDENTLQKKLKDAVFVLYKVDGTNKKYYKWNTESKKVEWVVNIATATPQKTDANGKATFEGLKEGTYYLEETKAPDGYNKLKKDVKVEITATYKENGELGSSSATSDHNGQYIQVQSIANKAGAVLPSTGGIGTTIFYVLGSIMALGAAVLLIAKKRMNGQDN